METILKIAKESAEEANMMGKLTSLYQVLNDVQKRINEIEKKHRHACETCDCRCST